MLLRNKKNNNGNIIQQFQDFKRQLQNSGKTPQQILNELVSSGKVSQEQLNNAKNMAQMFSYLIK